MVNDAAQMFSAKTNMYIWETTCDFTQNTIRSYDYNNHYLDAVVLSHPEHEVPTSKHISFNIFENHPFSSTTDCHTLTQDPNLQYITNHEFGHFAGLYHVPENEDQNNDFMSDNCNRAYASLPQKYVKEINSLYPIIPSWIKANAQLWSSDQIDDATFTASLQYLLKEKIIDIEVPESDDQSSTFIPSWLKTNVRLWHAGVLHDRTFANATSYLIQMGVIQLGTSPATSVLAISDDVDSTDDADSLRQAASSNATTIIPNADSSPRCEPNCFIPSVLRVATGATVTFSNTDDASHTFTHGDPYDGLGGTWDSGLVQAGQKYSVTLSKAGTYRYFSMIDPWMQGSIIVGGSATTNRPPTANAGSDRTVDERSTVVLSGVGTDPESRALRYSWNQISGPSVLLSHSNYPGATSTSQNPSFTAPEAPASSNVVLQFRLTVKDDATQRATDTVTITVRNTDTVPNRAPTASAGADQSVSERAAVTLDGSGSSDPDAGDVLSYKWTQLRGPTVALSSTSAQSPTFTAPDVSAGSVTLQFKLVVRDSAGAPGHPDYTSVTVSDIPPPPSNGAPSTLSDLAQTSGTDPVTIDVLFNDSDPDGDALSISSVDTANTSGTVSIKSDKTDLTFTASSGFSGTTTFTYVAVDARGASSPPTRVTVDVLRPPSAAGALWARAYVPAGGVGFFGQALDALPNGNVLVGTPSQNLVSQLAASSGSFVYTLDRTASEGFGSSIAALGTSEAVVGAPLYDDASGTAKSDAGRAYVLNSAGAVRLTIPHPEPAAGDKFGASVAADAANGRIFVGAPERDIVVSSESSGQQSQPADLDGATEPASADLDLVWTDISGPARVVDRSAGTVVHEIASFVAYDPFEGAPAADLASQGSDGAGVDTSATKDEDDPAYYDGAPPVLELDSEESLASLLDADTQRVLASARISALQSSTADSAEGQQLIAFHNERTGTSYIYDMATARLSMTEYRWSGAVYVFNSSTGAHISPPILNPHPGSRDRFGYSIDVMANGNLAVGTPRDEPRSAGSVYVMNGSTKAQVYHLDNPSSPHGAGDDFGSAVAAAGNYLVIGAPDDDGAGNAGPGNSGAVYVYDGASGLQKAYLPAATHAAPGVASSDDFGEAVAGSDDGKLVVGGSEDGEYVLFFSFDGTDASLVKKIAPSEAAHNRFGSALAVSGAAKNVAVSDYAYNPNGTVFLYDSLPPPPPPNSPPSATDDAVTVAEDSPATAVVVLSNDTDADGDALSVTSVNAKDTHGTAAVSATISTSSATSVLFTPEPDFSGTTSFSYMISDGRGGTDTASVTVTVTPVNDAPEAEPDSALVREDDSVAIRVLDNDGDADGDALSVHSVDGSGARGTVTVGPNGTVTFRPAADATGDTSFTYRASDGNGGISEPAAVVVVISPEADAPAAAPDGAATLEDEPVIVAVLSNDTDVDSDPLRVSEVTVQPEHGTATVDVDGMEIQYDPDSHYHGTDSFWYAVVDSSGLTSTARVSVEVESVNDAPFVPPLDMYTVMPGETVSFEAVYVDYDSDTAVFSLSGSVPSGASISAAGIFSWTPDPGHAGAHTFDVTVTDTGTPPLSGSATLRIGVLDVAPPFISAPSDVDVEATGPLTRVLLGSATATDNADQNPEITHDAPTSFPLGETTVTWTARDASGNSATDAQTVTVRDTTPPDVIAPPEAVAEASGSLTQLTPDDYGAAAAVDAADPAPSVSSDAPESFPLGITVIVWSATDSSGNVGIDTQSVWVGDTTPPRILVPEASTFEATGSLTELDSGDYGAPQITDAFGFSASDDAPISFPLGTTVITHSATDIHANSAVAMQRVTLADTTPPDFGELETAYAVVDSALDAVEFDAPSATDLVSGAVHATCDPPSNSHLGLGTTLITCTATDGVGNSSVASFDVVVSLYDPGPAPVIAPPPDIELEATGVLTPLSPSDYGRATATDGAGASFPVSSDAPASFPLGATIVTYTATGTGGLATGATQQVTVRDTMPPSVSPPPDIQAMATGFKTAVDIGLASATDTVSGNVEVSSDAPDRFPAGETVVTWTATDSSGNSAMATQKVVLTPPTETILHETFDNLDLWTDAPYRPYWRPATPGEAGHPPDHALPNRVVKFHGCAPCSLTLKEGLDLTGYSSASMSVWTYMEPTLGWFDSLRMYVTTDDGAPWELVHRRSTASDTERWTKETLDLSEYLNSSNFKIILYANGGNVSAVHMIDDLIVSGTPVPSDAPPTVHVPDFAVVRGSSATVAVSVSDPDGDHISLSMSGNPDFVTLGDDGGSATVTASPSVDDAGVHRVTVTATANSKVATNEFSVHIIDAVDSTAPTVEAPSDITVEASSYTSTVILGSAIASDNSGVLSSVTNDSPDGFRVGTTTVTWTATDSFGNMSTDTQTVNVRDTTAPVFETGNLFLVAYGDRFTHDVVATDAVDGDLTDSVSATGTVDSLVVGTYPVTYSVSDSSGNAAQFVVSFRVVDWNYPIITLSGSTNVLVKTGGSFTDPGATAVDPIINTPLSVRTGGQVVDTETTGLYRITYHTTDANGNRTVAQRMVTVNPNPESPPGTYLTIRNPVAVEDGFASVVAGLGNNMVAVGAPHADNGRFDSGAVYVYNADTGTMIRKLQHHDPRDRDFFGVSIAPVGDDKMLVASMGRSVHLYNTTDWTRLLDIQNPTTIMRGYNPFGLNIASLDNGNLVVSNHTERLRSGAGAIYVFDQQGNLVHRILNPDLDPPRNTWFGYPMITTKNDIITLAYSYSEGHNTIYRFNGLTGVLLDTKTSPTDRYTKQFGMRMSADPSAGLLTSDYNASHYAGRGYLYTVDGAVREMTPLFYTPAFKLGYGVALTSDNAVLGSFYRYYPGPRDGGLYVYDQDEVSKPFAFIPNPFLHAPSFGHPMQALGDNKVIIGNRFARALGTDIAAGAVHLANTGSRDLLDVSPSSATDVSPSDAHASAHSPSQSVGQSAAQHDGVHIDTSPLASTHLDQRLPVMLGFDLADRPPVQQIGVPADTRPPPDRTHAFITLRFDSSVENLPMLPWDFAVSSGSEQLLVVDAVSSGNSVILTIERDSISVDGLLSDPRTLDVHVLAPWAAVPTVASEGATVEITDIDIHDTSILMSWNMFGDEKQYKAVIAPVSDPRSKHADVVQGIASYRFVNLEPDTEYEIRVGVRGDDSTQAIRTVKTLPVGQMEYYSGLSLGATITSGIVNLSWADINDTGDGRYRVERSVDGEPFAEIAGQPGSATQVADSIKPEWSGKQVSYRVFEWVGKQKLYSDAISFVAMPP